MLNKHLTLNYTLGPVCDLIEWNIKPSVGRGGPVQLTAPTPTKPGLIILHLLRSFSRRFSSHSLLIKVYLETTLEIKICR